MPNIIVNSRAIRPNHPMMDKLVAYFPLGEPSGSRVDLVGGNHLADNATVTQGDGIIGKAAQFTRVNSEFLSIADNQALSMGVGLASITLWMNFTTAPGAGNDYVFLSKWDATEDEYFLTSFGNNGAIGVEATIRNSADTATSTATNNANLSAGIWYFIHAYVDGATLGVSVNAGTPTTTAFTTTIRDGAAPFRLGGMGNSTNFFNGLLQHVFIWKGRKLTRSEEAWMFNGGKGRAFPFLAN